MDNEVRAAQRRIVLRLNGKKDVEPPRTALEAAADSLGLMLREFVLKYITEYNEYLVDLAQALKQPQQPVMPAATIADRGRLNGSVLWLPSRN